MKTATWHTASWRKFPAAQQPIYKDQKKLCEIECLLNESVALVSHESIEVLLCDLRKVALGDKIILQGGDCVETFASVNEPMLSGYFQLMQETKKLLKEYKGVVVIGRVAGQFAKPRSSCFEVVSNVKYPIYRGDIINSIELSAKKREHDPARMLSGYNCSVEALRILNSVGFSVANNSYISHEVLILNYAECFTRRVENKKYYNLSAHFLWIGNRTRDMNSAHIEYVRGIANPIGIKIDQTISTDELLRLIDVVNPDNIPGKLVLIFRMGANNITKYLPALIKVIKAEGKAVILMCDPMHGNTMITEGQKTRNINTILLELKCFIFILKAEKMHFGGVHLEMTHKKILECVDDNQMVQDYRSYCDPRLNYQQSIKVAKFIVNRLKI